MYCYFWLSFVQVQFFSRRCALGLVCFQEAHHAEARCILAGGGWPSWNREQTCIVNWSTAQL